MVSPYPTPCSDPGSPNRSFWSEPRTVALLVAIGGLAVAFLGALVVALR